jgi:hypothetical protein
MPRPMDAETKARALADLRAGCGVRETGRVYGVDPGTLTRWRDAEAANIAVLPTEKKQERIDLAVKVTLYVDEALDTLITHLRLARDPEWFARQDAAALATFDGVHHDKLVRVLAALQRGAAAYDVGRAGADDDGDDAAGPGDDADA